MVNFDECENKDYSYDYTEFVNLLMNQIKGGHKIKICVYDIDRTIFNCKFTLEFYTDLSVYNKQQASQIQLHLDCSQ